MKKISVVIIFLISAVASMLALYYFGTIRQIDCVFDNQFSPHLPVCEQLQQLTGSRLFFRDFYQDAQVADLLYVEQTKEIYDIQTVQKSLDGTVTLTLTDRPPLYKIEREGQLFLVTAAGGFRENDDRIQVPVLRDESGLYDQQTAIVHQFLTGFLNELEEKRTEVQEIRLVSETRVEILVTGLPITITELRQNPQQAARRLKIVLEELRPQEIELGLRELDLRFELPVLRSYTSGEESTEESTDSAQVQIDSQE